VNSSRLIPCSGILPDACDSSWKRLALIAARIAMQDGRDGQTSIRHYWHTLEKKRQHHRHLLRPVPASARYSQPSSRHAISRLRLRLRFPRFWGEVVIHFSRWRAPYEISVARQRL